MAGASAGAGAPGGLSGDPRYRAAMREMGMLSVAAVPLVARGRALGAITLASATAFKSYGPSEVALAEELARRAALAIDNARLYQQAQEAIRLREEFLVVASHELNTPVASLRLASQSVSPTGDLPPPDVLRRVLSMIDRQTARLADLIVGVFDVSQVQSGSFRVQLEPLDLGAVVRTTVERIRPEMERARCSPDLDIAEGILGSWDLVGIERIVVNLLSNAMKFGPRQSIEVRLRAQADRAILTVRDQGIGIEPDLLSTIFDRFKRGVSAEHYGGLGLGLYVVREIAAAMGGSVGVDSAPGRGSTFTVTLPLQPSPTGRPL